MQVTMVIDMNEEVEKSSGPAKLTDEVMGIMCRWFWRTIILVRIVGENFDDYDYGDFEEGNTFTSDHDNGNENDGVGMGTW